MSKTGRIQIHDLRGQTLLGVYDHERKELRDVVLHIALDVDHARVEKDDALHSAVDYDVLSQELRSHLAKSTKRTIESLAVELADICLEHSGVMKVRLRLEKPGAIPHARSVSYEMKRRKKK